MRAVLPIISKCEDEIQDPPPLPTLVLEHDGQVAYYSRGWHWHMAASNLESVTPDLIREAGHLDSAFQVSLSQPREVPYEDLTSPEALEWARTWWREEVARIRREALVRTA